ncbi:MAG: copper resistance protein B [Gallionellaceae bacterium]
MIFKRNNISAIALSLAVIWGQQAIAADDMSTMDMSGGDAPKMQGGSAPANARDPHAYSGGYDFGPIERPHMADEAIMSGVNINRLERTQTRDNTYYNAYELQGWVGKDYERMVVKAEGEIDEGKIHEARTELLWNHATSAYWNAQVGLRNDSGVAPTRNWLAMGMQGLAPYWFEIDAAAYVGDQGRTALRLSAEYELLFTQKLILQPRVEANFYGMKDVEREIGAGLSNIVAGLRLRYEIRREFAPYIGIDWNSKLGETADMAKAGGVSANDRNLVAGLRMWF